MAETTESIERFERSINRLNDIMDLLMDTLEKGARKNTPASMYFARRGSRKSTSVPDEADFKEFNELTKDELSSLKRSVHKNIEKTRDQIKDEIAQLDSEIRRESDLAIKTVLESRRAEAKAREDTLDKQYERTSEIERLTNLIEKETDASRRNLLESIRERKESELLDARTGFPNIYSDAQAERRSAATAKYSGTEFGSREGREIARSNNAERDEMNEAYEARRRDLQDISREVSHSGLGNNSFGRSVINATNRRQRIDAMGNFGGNLKLGKAADISRGLFGNGGAASKATSMLTKFGGALSKVSKVLGPFATIISFAIDALKAVAKIANEYQKQTAMFIRYQTDIEKISYEQAKQHSMLATQMDVETIKYVGDMAIKLMETEGANMLEAMDIQNSQFVKSMEIATGSIMKGINQTAYDAAAASIDAAASMRKLETHQEQRKVQMGTFAAQRGLEAEKNIATAQADINVADAVAAAERLAKANELEQNQLDMAAKATNDLISGNFTDAIANGMGFFRNAESNTTTGEYASGDTNPMNASKVKIDTYKAFGVDKIPGWDSSLVGPNAVGAATMGLFNGGDRSGYREKETAIVENAAQHITQDADAVKTKTDLYYMKASAEQENAVKLAEKETELVTQASEKTIEAAANIEKNWLALTQHVEGFIEKFDKRFNDLGLNLGILNKSNLFDYKQRQLSVISEVARAFGKNEEEVAKYQSEYVGETGRNKMFSVGDTRQLAALGTYLGDDGLATRFASEMEIFNAGAAESVDLLDESLQSVNRIGLNGRKYTKDLVSNLKLAQKYNFKGGTKEVMEMAKWAQKTRFNLQSLGGIVDKIQEGGIEGVIQQSAQLQVLGGQAAMRSDPLGMLYDAWGDNASLAKRFQDMTKGFGTLDKKTGETTFKNIAENMQIAAIAKAQGRSVEELRGEIMERNKREVVKNQLSSEQRQKFDSEEIDFLGSVAKYNRKKQRFEVTLSDGETRGINEITSKELGRAMPQEHEERMETWMEQLVSVVNKMSGETVAENADIAAATYKQTLDSFNSRLSTMNDEFIGNFDTFVGHVKEEQTRIEGSVKSYLDRFANEMQNDTTGINAEVSKIKAKASDISTALGGVAKVIDDAKIKIAEAAGLNITNYAGARSKESITEDAKGNVGATKAKQRNAEGPDNNNYQPGVQKYRDNMDESYAYGGTFGNSVYAPSDITGRVNIDHPRMVIPTNDGVMRSRKEPMAVAASDITPINDGSIKLAKTNPNDVGLFAKSGGPFDTLFNGVFGKISSIYDAMSDKLKEKRGVLPDSLKEMYDTWSSPYERDKRQNELYGVKQNVTDKRDVNVNINGKLLLDGGKQQIDLLVLLRENPDLVRKITEAVINQMSSNANGGKYEMFSNRYYR